MDNEFYFQGLMTVVYNEKKDIERIINPQNNLLLKLDSNKLIGKNIDELDRFSELEDKSSIQTIIENVRHTDKKTKKFFKYPVNLNNKEKVDAVCMSEQRDNGYVYVNVFRTNQYSITDGKEIFKNIILDHTIYNSPIGLSISHINKKGEKYHILFNDAIKKIYFCDDITLSTNWDENEDNRTDVLTLKNSPYTYNRKLFDADGNIKSWIMTTKKKIDCNDDNGYFIISTTTDVTSLYDNFSNLSDLKLYFSLYNSIPMSVAVYDVNGILRSVNSRYIKLFSVDYNKIVNIRNIQSDKNIPKWAFEKLKKGDTITYNNIYEIEEPNKNDSSKTEIKTHLLSVNMIPIKNSHNSIIGYSQTFDDITERNIDNHLLEVLHKNLPIGIIVYDKEGNLLSVNDKNREIMGIPFSVNLEDVNLFKEPNLSDEYIQKLKAGEDIVFDLDYNFDDLNGYFETSHKRIKKLHIKIVVIWNNGFIDGYLLMNQDMTSIKENETLLLENNKKLDVALKNSGLVFWEYKCDEGFFRSNDSGIFVNKEKRKTIDDYSNVIDPLNKSKFVNVKNIIDNRIDESFCVEGIFEIHDTKEKRNIIFSGEPYLIDSSGKVISYVGYRKDVTNEKNLYENIKLLDNENKVIIDNIDFGLAYINRDYKILWSNASSLKSRNLNQFKLYTPGHTCYKVVFNRDTPCEHCVIKDAINCGHKVTHTDIKIGDEYYEISANPVEASTSLDSGYLLKVADITHSFMTNIELSKNKEELKNLNYFLKESIMYIPIGISIKDARTGKYIMANEEFSRIFNTEHSYIEGKNIFEICNKKVSEEITYQDEISAKTTEDRHVFLLKFDNGKNKIPFEVHKVLINITDDKAYIVSAVIDMTEKVNTINELNIAKEHAEESDRLKSAFLANMSHEIRTPLNSIVGFSEVIAENDNKQENAEYFKIIQRNNQILLRLINDILDLSKLDAGVIKLQNKEFDLAEMDSNFRAFYDNGKLNDEVEFITDLPYSRCIVNLDEQRFIQVCNNFISNAIKYTNRGYIKYGYSYVDNGIKIYVKDTGIGIPKKLQNKLFTRFGKLNDDIQGNGLGLTICKAILEIQKGKIGFESEENKGSTFWAWFPTKADVEFKIDDYYKANVNNGAKNIISKVDSELSQNNNTGMNILVAEDIDSNYLLLKTLLKGYNLIRAKNGKEAVELAQNKNFNLIFMDIKMPVMDGLEATRLIREFNKDIQIIALTANAFDVDRQAALESGCSAFMTKPIRLHELKSIMNSFS